MKAAIFALALAVGLSPMTTRAEPTAAESEKLDNLVRDFMICARRNAERLEPSGDSPRDVASAAVYLCQQEELAAGNYAIQTKATLSMTQLRDAALFYGSGQAVTARLCRKTKDCGLAPLPSR